jgi:hypothetical protein
MTNYIQIPVQDFSFEEVIKRKARATIMAKLGIGNIASSYIGTFEGIQQHINEQISSFSTVNDKLIYVSELIIHVNKIKADFNEERDNSLPTDKGGKLINLKITTQFNEKFDDLLYFLYALIKQEGYELDKNAFVNEEIIDLDRKINAILIKLDEIQVGNEVIFNEVDELKNKLKEDFKSLKSDYPLGKKRWYQRAAGVVVTYAGTKGADEIYEQLKPLLHDFFVNIAPHIIDKL